MKNFAYHLLAIATIAIWGVTFVNTKVLLHAGLDPLEIFVLRFAIAYLCILAFSRGKLKSKSWKDELLFVVLGIVGGSLYFLAENEAIGISYVNNVAFIVCTAPLITMLLGLLFVKDIKATPPLIIGSVIALIGVGVVIYNGKFVLRLNPKGDLLALTAALSWALYSLIIKKISLRYGAVFITRKVFFYGLLTALPVFLLRPWTFPVEGFARPEVWMNLVFLAVIASFACFFFWSVAVSKIGVMQTSNYIYLNPVTTVIASALVLDEPMTSMAYIGSALILAGVFVANKLEVRR